MYFTHTNKYGDYTVTLDDNLKTITAEGNGLKRTESDGIRPRLHVLFDSLNDETKVLAWLKAAD